MTEDNLTGALVYVGCGSNLGDREANHRGAAAALKRTPGVRVMRCSSLREYPPMGPPQPDYLNGVIEVGTTLAPDELLAELHRIEADLGRQRQVHWGPRTMDLDILFWENRVVDTELLSIPHPGACERLFVLEPLSELAPDLVDPESGRTISEILERVGL